MRRFSFALSLLAVMLARSPGSIQQVRGALVQEGTGSPVHGAAEVSLAGVVTPSIHGRVLEAYTDLPIAQATVDVMTADSRIVGAGITDSSGRFAIEIEKGGTYWIRISRPPAVPIVEGPIDVAGGADVEVVFHVDWPSIQPILLDSLAVAVEARSSRLDRVGYYLRMKTEGGTFIGPEILEKRTLMKMSDIFRTLPGIRVVESDEVGLIGTYPVTSYSLRTSLRRRTCWPRIYLNGMVVEQGGYHTPLGSFDSLVQGADLAGIEVYSSPAEVPIAYGGASGAACGVYLIWTKG